MSTPSAPQAAARFARNSFDAQDASERVTLTGYRHIAAGKPTPWGVARHGKKWAVWHIPTGLLVRAELPTLDRAKVLCTTLDAAVGSDLPALDAQPFGEAPKPDTAAYREALGIWRALREWLRASPAHA